jgi:hypothetical protein
MQNNSHANRTGHLASLRLTSRRFHASLLVLAVLSSIWSRAAEEIMRAGDDSWHPVGVFCCKVITGGESEIRVFRLTGGKPETLFSKRMPGPSRSPICLSNAVVVVDTDGVIAKFNLRGDLMFSEKPERFRGSAMSSVRLGDRHILLTEMLEAKNKKAATFLLHVVDVSGEHPVHRSTREIIQPHRYAQIGDELVVIGEKRIQRLKLDEGGNY